MAGMRWTLVAGILLLSMLSIPAQGAERGAPPPVEDPVFGLLPDNRGGRLDEMPATVRQACGLRPEGRFWVIAHARAKDRDIYIATGVTPDRGNEPTGFTLELTEQGCKAGTAQWMLSGHPALGTPVQDENSYFTPGYDAPRLCRDGECHYVLRSQTEEAVLRGLMRDAIRRSATAWGGEQALRTRVCTGDALFSRAEYPIPAQELDWFCQQR